MVEESSSVTMKPIGFVRNKIKPASRRDYKKVLSEIIIDTGLTGVLDNLDEFSHIIVLYWMHKSRVPFSIKVHPMGNPELPLMGVFATRSPSRPNPIGKATVRLLQHQGNVLKVRGLDAIDGTPVLDIKPYIPGYDSVKNAKAPPWVLKQ